MTTRGHAREALLDAALVVVRRKGLHATTVDDLCAEAGVTKGAFFHHFASKEALAVAAAHHWSVTTGRLFADAGYHLLDDPVDRVMGYLDLREALLAGTLAEVTCLVGTMAQEAFATSPAIRDACGASIVGHASTLEADIAEALALTGDPERVSAACLARYTQVVLQGAFVVAKATDDPDVAHEALAFLRSHFRCIFTRQPPS